MILVDSSVWIDFFGRYPGRAASELKQLIERAEPLGLTGVVVAEVLQGLTRNVDQIEQYLSQWELLEPSGAGTYQHAARIYRTARASGLTLTTIDTIIAAISLEHRATLFTIDEDFSRLSRITELSLYPHRERPQ
ncbi:MAG TPA: PIN domain nuclease [Terriglobales bacterium]|nr:PIN domain nuclease [Terriglobales bacterium]